MPLFAPGANIFHILADVSHTISKIVLIASIHRNQSAEGVSLLTQLEYVVVFAARYLDLFWTHPGDSGWNFVLKILYIASSVYIVYIMLRVFARTREKEYAWRLAVYSMVGSLLCGPLVCLILEGWSHFTIIEVRLSPLVVAQIVLLRPSVIVQVLWTFSVVLESVCVLPQLLLLRQTTVPTVINSFYLLFLGSYRALYILNWLYQAFERKTLRPDYWTSVIFGIVQTALYVDFAWVYFTRQRVKLRGGGIVDSDDLRNSYLVKNFIGRRNNRNSDHDDEDITDEDAALAGQENGIIRPPVPRSGRNWGPRGISVSADDTLANHHDSDARMVDPSHFEDEEDEIDAPPPATPATPAKNATEAATPDQQEHEDEANEGVGSSASEWQDDGAK